MGGLVCLVLCPGCGLVFCFVLVCLSRAVGFILFGCLWCWCPCVGVWVFGLCISGFFCTGLMPIYLSFRGGAVRFSFFLGAFFFGFVCILFGGLGLLVINSYLSKKKKTLNFINA